MPSSSNGCINRESYEGHVLVEFCGKFRLDAQTAFSSNFVSRLTLPEFAYIPTGWWHEIDYLHMHLHFLGAF